MARTVFWKLTFSLTEYTPQEVERITGLSAAMQRDWRHRGYLPKTGKHARFDILSVAELFFMKAYSDQGKGPSLSMPHAPKAAAAIAKSAILWRNDSWANSPDDVFDQIPASHRWLTQSEIDDIEDPDRLMTIPEENRGPDEFEKRMWLADELFRELRIDASRSPRNIIWWPTNELELGSLDPDGISSPSEGNFFDRIDPKHMGPALVLHVESFAANLVRMLPRPCISASVELLDPANQPNSVMPKRRSRGEVVIEWQRTPRRRSNAAK